VLERILTDRMTRAPALGVVSFKPIRFNDLRSASKASLACCTGRVAAGKVPPGTAADAFVSRIYRSLCRPRPQSLDRPSRAIDDDGHRLDELSIPYTDPATARLEWIRGARSLSLRSRRAPS